MSLYAAAGHVILDKRTKFDKTTFHLFFRFGLSFKFKHLFDSM